MQQAEKVIKIKRVIRALHAVGQVLGHFFLRSFPDKVRRIHLFGEAEEFARTMRESGYCHQ